MPELFNKYGVLANDKIRRRTSKIEVASLDLFKELRSMDVSPEDVKAVGLYLIAAVLNDVSESILLSAIQLRKKEKENE